MEIQSFHPLAVSHTSICALSDRKQKIDKWRGDGRRKRRDSLKKRLLLFPFASWTETTFELEAIVFTIIVMHAVDKRDYGA